MTSLDLTPFGFTPTESLAYEALLKHGTSSGYSLAKALNLARANMYQALHGLVSKGAAISAAPGPPQRFRAVSPRALLAQVAQRESEQLDRLEQQLLESRAPGAELLVEFRTRRAFEELALRTAARTRDAVTFLGPPALVTALIPLWRKRAADRAPTAIWVVGHASPASPIEPAGEIDPAWVQTYFGSQASILLTAETALLARLADPDSCGGYWSADPVLLGVARAAVSLLTGS